MSKRIRCITAIFVMTALLFNLVGCTIRFEGTSDIVVDVLGESMVSGETAGFYVGENGNWWFGGIDMGLKAGAGDSEESAGSQTGDGAPVVGKNGNWWINGKDTGISTAGSGSTSASRSRTSKTTVTTEKENDHGATEETTVRPTRTTASSGKPTSLSWGEVKQQIPSFPKGTKLRVYDWNPTTEVPGLDAVNINFTYETGINVSYIIEPYATYFTKISALVAAKNAPDAVRLQNVSKQNLINLQPFNGTGYNFNDTYWDQNVIEAYTFNGNIYGVNMVGSPYYSPYIVYYNTNLIETYGLDDPYALFKKGEWTWDKLWEMCDEFVAQSSYGDFIGLSTMEGMEYQLAHNTPAITYNKKTNTFSHNLKNATFIKSWQVYANKFDKGLISYALTNNDAFDNGKLLFNISTGIAARDGSAYFRDLRQQGAVACVPLPALKQGNEDYQLLQEVQAFGIPAGAKNGDLTPYYLRYYFDASNYDMKNFYNVKNAEEVIGYIHTKGPKISYNGAVMTSEQTGFNTAQFIDKLKTGGAANVKMTLDAYVPAVEASMREMQMFFAAL